jgi:hypothetical protein
MAMHAHMLFVDLFGVIDVMLGVVESDVAC